MPSIPGNCCAFSQSPTDHDIQPAAERPECRANARVQRGQHLAEELVEARVQETLQSRNVRTRSHGQGRRPTEEEPLVVEGSSQLRKER